MSYKKLSKIEEMNSSLNLFYKTLFSIIFVYILIKLYRIKVNRNVNNSKSLRGKVVVITGASSGLGKALSQVFYKSGARIILSSRNVNQLEEVKQWLINGDSTSSDQHFEPQVLRLDLSESNQMESYAKRVLNYYGKIDLLINNGGISYRGTTFNTTIDVDRQLMEVNYFGQIALIKEFLPKMIQQNSGQIVVISSIQGRLPLPYRSAYTASKHALEAFCDSLRAELFETNISVSVISPGYIKTNLSVNALTGSGHNYGLMDATTASGIEPEVAAKHILLAVLKKEKHMTLSPIIPKIAVLIRFLFPDIYYYIMRKRAQKEINN